MKPVPQRLSDWARRNVVFLAALLVLTPLWAAAHVAIVPYLAEDSYIHFRVAENLVRFGQAHFNPGEAVKTSSSTPWTWLLALQFLIDPRNLSLVAVTSALISAAGAVSFAALLQTLAGRRLAIWEGAAIALVYLVLVQEASVLAMETPLALLLATEGLRAYCRGKPWAFGLLALAACTRPELTVLGILVGAAALLTRSVPLKPSLAWGLLGLFPASAFDLVQYGTLVPHAAIAKSAIHSFTLSATFMQSLPEAILREIHLSAILFVAYAVGFVVLATLPVLTLRWSRPLLKEMPVQVMILAAVTGLAIAATYLAARGLVFPWYRPLYFLFLFLPALIWIVRHQRWTAYLGVLIAAAPFVYDFGGTLIAASGRPEAFRHFLEGARARNTVRVSAQLAELYPDAVMMTSEIGAVGFGFGGRVEDGAGIASPKALSYHPLAVPQDRATLDEAPVPRQFLRDVRPGLVIAVDQHLDAVLRDPIRAEYVHIRHRLYDERDEARRVREDLLWKKIRYLDVLIRNDLWQRRQPSALSSR